MENQTRSDLYFDGEHGVRGNQLAGGFFSNARNFVIAGGNFNISVYQAAPITSDFHMISLGDLDLRHTMGPDGAYGVVRQRGRASVRRVYSARLHGSMSSMTAALYEGEGAEEQWREDVARYSKLRHPNLLQLYGTVNSAGLHAAIFHEELIPVKQFLKRYHDSHFSTVYCWALMDEEFEDVRQYMYSLSGKVLDWYICTVWIRPSTGCLSIDLTPPDSDPVPLVRVNNSLRICGTSLFEPYEASEMIASMPLDRYHDTCYFHLYQWYSFTISTPVPVIIGSIRRLSGRQYESSMEIACIPECSVRDLGWSTSFPNVEDLWSPVEGSSLMMENGWICVTSAVVANEYRRQIFPDYEKFPWSRYWLAQASYIFKCFDAASNFEDYVMVAIIEYFVKFSGPIDNLPSGYLFLCPLAELQSESSKCFRRPDCPAYWSLDPSGAERLGATQARERGFPDIQFGMDILGRFWDETVYDGLRQFHTGKGFDPDSQEVARELGVPLFPISWNRNRLIDGGEDPAELISPLAAWNVVICVQIALMLTLGAFWVWLFSRLINMESVV